MAALDDLLAAGRPVAAQRPWPRAIVDEAGWRRAGDALADGALSLLALWGEPGAIHVALLDEAAGAVGALSLDCPDGRFPSLGARHAAAIRPERAVQDLAGLVAVGLPDPRRWLDHGRWSPGVPPPYDFLPVEGESLHQIPVGPVHAGIIEPGHFRFTASGETVVRLEERLGYVHKGTEALMQGAPLARAAKLAGRLSGDSTVAATLGFARAAEAALEIDAPPRAVWLRALMAELERIANHCGDIGAICNDASFILLHAHFGALRERVLRASEACFGHRLMMDRIVPGGVAADLGTAEPLHALLAEIRRAWPALVGLYDQTASLQDRTASTGFVPAELVRRFAAGGYVGRASGRTFDARRALPYPPYDALRFEVPTLAKGDVDSRVRIRIREVEQSLSLVGQILAGLPQGSLQAELPAAAGEGLAVVEAFRGDLLVWLRIASDGTVARCHLRDASWFQWPLLEAAIEGNIVADFPLCNKSFNCSYSGHDV